MAKKVTETSYREVWLCLVHFRAPAGKQFNDLVDQVKKGRRPLSGAWGTVLVKSKDIDPVASIVRDGSRELGLDVVQIERIENVTALIEAKEIAWEIVRKADWLVTSNFVFVIAGQLHGYVEHSNRSKPTR